jgi:hypothetical protein
VPISLSYYPAYPQHSIHPLRVPQPPELSRWGGGVRTRHRCSSDGDGVYCRVTAPPPAPPPLPSLPLPLPPTAAAPSCVPPLAAACKPPLLRERQSASRSGRSTAGWAVCSCACLDPLASRVTITQGWGVELA